VLLQFAALPIESRPDDVDPGGCRGGRLPEGSGRPWSG
jgi:hypothetical protein